MPLDDIIDAAASEARQAALRPLTLETVHIGLPPQLLRQLQNLHKMYYDALIREIEKMKLIGARCDRNR